MKNKLPFDLEKALSGEFDIVNGDGNKVLEIHCFNTECPFPIVAVMEDPEAGGVIATFTKEGQWVEDEKWDENDLFLMSKSKTYYANVYKFSSGDLRILGAFKSEAEAMDNTINAAMVSFVKTISFELEE